MSFRLRRGTNAERLLITPDEGEPLFTTDTQKLYVGDGSTAGGIELPVVSGADTILAEVQKGSGGTIVKGTPVYISGWGAIPSS